MVTTPEQLAMMLRSGQGLDRQGQQIAQAPARGAMHWSQALAGALGQGVGGYMQGSAARQEGEGRMTGEKDLAAGMQGDREALARALQNPWVGDKARQWQAQAPARARAAAAASRQEQMHDLNMRYRQAQID